MKKYYLYHVLCDIRKMCLPLCRCFFFLSVSLKLLRHKLEQLLLHLLPLQLLQPLSWQLLPLKLPVLQLLLPSHFLERNQARLPERTHVDVEPARLVAARFGRARVGHTVGRLRHRLGPRRRAPGGRPLHGRPRLSERTPLPAENAKRRRLVARPFPQQAVSGLFRERLSAREGPVHLLRRQRLGHMGDDPRASGVATNRVACGPRR